MHTRIYNNNNFPVKVTNISTPPPHHRPSRSPTGDSRRNSSGRVAGPSVGFVLLPRGGGGVKTSGRDGAVRWAEEAAARTHARAWNVFARVYGSLYGEPVFPPVQRYGVSTSCTHSHIHIIVCVCTIIILCSAGRHTHTNTPGYTHRPIVNAP